MQNGLNHYKILFPINTNANWLGGVNYYKNLFKALLIQNEARVEIFIPHENSEILFDYAKPYNFYKKDFSYYIEGLLSVFLFKKFNKEYYFSKRAENFDVFSHVNHPQNFRNTLSWIPDFQHIHLPEFFSPEENVSRDKDFLNKAKNSNIVLLSSKDAQKDFINLYPDFKEKSRVLHFVSYIDPEIYNMTGEVKDDIYQKYNLPEKYFYLPNQFWVHKNHLTVFKAVKNLKEKGVNINILCTGNTNDYRNSSHFENLKKYIFENNLENNIKILGIISLDEVYCLIRNSVAVINPSLFEGWSSTVEEVKSLGKKIILSDLNVHKEQNPPFASYFSKENFEELSEILEMYWHKYDAGPDFELEKDARAAMNERMMEFGRKYIEIIRTL